MTQGKISARVPRKKRDWHDILMTIIGSDVPESQIMRMTPTQRRQAREAWERTVDSPGYRNWFAEFSSMHKKYEAGDWKGARRPDWREYLISIDRLDLFMGLSSAAGTNNYHCGKCHSACEALFCIPGEVRWLCLACTAGRPAQRGS